jgi:hypothetical protein
MLSYPATSVTRIVKKTKQKNEHSLDRPWVLFFEFLRLYLSLVILHANKLHLKKFKKLIANI